MPNRNHISLTVCKTLQWQQAVICVQFFQITPPLFILVKLCVLFPHDFKQAALHGDKRLVHIALVGLPTAAEILIRQFHIAATFFDIYFSWCIFHRFFLQSEFWKCKNPDWKGGERQPTAETALRHIPIKNDKRKTAKRRFFIQWTYLLSHNLSIDYVISP